MTHNQRIENDFWKNCKKIFKSQDKVLSDCKEKICYEHFIKSL